MSGFHITPEEFSKIKRIEIVSADLRLPKVLEDGITLSYPEFQITMCTCVHLTWGRERFMNLRGQCYYPERLTLKVFENNPKDIRLLMTWYDSSSGFLIDNVCPHVMNFTNDDPLYDSACITDMLIALIEKRNNRIRADRMHAEDCLTTWDGKRLV